METVLPLRTTWIVDILSQASLRDVHRQRCWKRGSGDGQRRTTRLSDRSTSMPFPLCATPLKGEALDCEETTVLCFLPSWSTLLFERGLGEEGRFDVASRSETPNSPKTSRQNHKQQLLRPRSGPAQTPTTLVKQQQVLSKYRKRNQINTKNYWK